VAKKNNVKNEYAAYRPPTSDEILAYLVRTGAVDIDDIDRRMRDHEKIKVIESHPYSISCGKDGRWRTWVKDEWARGGRRKIARCSRESLEDALYTFYTGYAGQMSKDKRLSTIRTLYPRWLEYKKLHKAEPTYIARIESDWKRYYDKDPIVDIPVKKLKKMQMDEWVHKLICNYDLTKNAYYNITVIMRQVLHFAVDLEIIKMSPLDRVFIDSRRVFRKERKQKSATQVFTKEEVKTLFRIAWDDYKNNDNPQNGLAPLAMMFQFYTGLRLGELCVLKHADLQGDILYVSRMLQKDTNTELDRTKSHKDREVLIPDAALSIVKEARKYQEENDIETEYIFSADKNPLSYKAVNELLKRYCKEANILYRSSHKIRKTYISTLIDAGVNIDTIREYVGHEDERTTYHSYCYDRTSDKAKKEVLEKAFCSNMGISWEKE